MKFDRSLLYLGVSGGLPAIYKLCFTYPTLLQMVTGVMYILWLLGDELFGICDNECAKLCYRLIGFLMTVTLYIAGQ